MQVHGPRAKAAAAAKMRCALSCGNTGGSVYEENSALEYNQSASTATSGMTKITLGTTWKKYYVHFYAESTVTNATAIGIRISTEDSLPSNCTFSVCGLKLEEGYITSYERTDYKTVIQQTSRTIDMSVLVNSVKKAGIELTTNQEGDVTNGVINLMAGKVNFVDPNGNPYQTPKVSIDPTTGALTAVDGNFTGIVTASSGQIGGVTINSDGSLETSGNAAFSGRVIASSGNIGGFEIIQVDGMPTLKANVTGVSSLAMNNGGINFSNWTVSNAPFKGKFTVGVQDNIVTAIGAKRDIGENIPSLCALQLSAEGNADVCSALDILKGVVTGLKLYVKVITTGSSYTPDVKVGIIILKTGINSGFQLKLPTPSADYNGKFYFIKNKSNMTGQNCKITVDGADEYHNYLMDNNGGYDYNRNLDNDSLVVCCDGEHWIMFGSHFD